VAHTYNPNYLGGSEREDGSLKLAWANSSRDPVSKIPNTKRAGGVTQGVGSEFKPHCHQKQKQKSFKLKIGSHAFAQG
jgi:hypothetical protein